MRYEIIPFEDHGFFTFEDNGEVRATYQWTSGR